MALIPHGRQVLLCHPCSCVPQRGTSWNRSGSRPPRDTVVLAVGATLLYGEVEVRPDGPRELDGHLAKRTDGSVGRAPVGLERLRLPAELGADGSVEIVDEALRLAEERLDS